MRKYTQWLSALTLSILLNACSGAQPTVNSATDMNTSVEYALAAHPDNKPGEEVTELWGEKIPDPYRWLENINDPAVQEWAKAQDKRARDFIAQLPGRDAFHKRLEQLLYVPNITTPDVNGGAMFYYAREAKAEKSVFYVRGVDESAEQARVLIDPNKLSEDGSISLRDTFPSPDGKLVAYTLNQNNADTAVLHILDVETGKDLGDIIEGARYAEPQWLNDHSGFYYTYFPTDPSIPTHQRPGMTDIRFHKVGTSEADDQILIPALNDPTKFHDVSISRDNHWLTYFVRDGWNGNSLKLKRLNDTDWVALDNKPNFIYASTIENDTMFMLTNEDAPKYKIVKIDLSRPNVDLSRDAWKTILPESQDRVIEDFVVLKDKLIVKTIKDVVNVLDVYDLEGNHIKSLTIDDKGTIGYLIKSSDDSSVYFAFTSFKTPKEIYRIDAQTLDMTVWDQVETTIDKDNTVVDQIFATSKDGTQVPMFVIRGKDTPLDGSAKTIVYGYGGFNVSITPFYQAAIYAWLEEGGIFVYSNLRGGNEYGEAWHNAGMRENKQNVFDDYFAVAETLIERKYTSREHIAAYGGSNGGLLTGAAMTQRPDLYGAIICAVPLLDMLRYHMFGSGSTWISEYMSVDDSVEAFNVIRAYTPYSNVKPGTAYPSILFLGADSDDRVDPMHIRKMTAAIQDATSSDNPVILRIEKNAGHGGADLTGAKIAEWSDIFAFLKTVLK